MTRIYRSLWSSCLLVGEPPLSGQRKAERKLPKRK